MHRQILEPAEFGGQRHIAYAGGGRDGEGLHVLVILQGQGDTVECCAALPAVFAQRHIQHRGGGVKVGVIESKLGVQRLDEIATGDAVLAAPPWLLCRHPGDHERVTGRWREVKLLPVGQGKGGGCRAAARIGSGVDHLGDGAAGRQVRFLPVQGVERLDTDAVAGNQVGVQPVHRHQRVVLAHTRAPEGGIVDRVEPVDAGVQQAFPPVDGLLAQAGGQPAGVDVPVGIGV